MENSYSIRNVLGIRDSIIQEKMLQNPNLTFERSHTNLRLYRIQFPLVNLFIKIGKKFLIKALRRVQMFRETAFLLHRYAMGHKVRCY